MYHAPAEVLLRWHEHPGQMVRELWPGVEPDHWQDDVLEAFPHRQRIAMPASKGVGKTAVLAWLAINFLLTRPHPRIAAASISAANLADNLWTETIAWINRSDILRAVFECTKSRIFARDHPETWWMSARSWSQSSDANEQANVLSGLHSDFVMFILDEVGGMGDAVMASAEAALSVCVEGHVLIAGNTTTRSGPLWRAVTSERQLWHLAEINGDPDNPRRANRVSIQWAREQIAKYGASDPFVLINVFGRFPPSSLNSLIGPDECREATLRNYRIEDYQDAARVIGLDVSRYGEDSTVLFVRQGLVAFEPLQVRGMDGTQGAGLVARKIIDLDIDGTFIDDTGGYGASWIDNLRRMGHTPFGIGFASKATDPRYANKRSEMHFNLVEWIKGGGRIPPNCPELIAALTSTSYTFTGDRLLIEPKESIKARLGYSPDHLDSLCLTFAHPVLRRTIGIYGARREAATLDAEYHPFGHMWNIGQPERNVRTYRGIGSWNN